VFFHLIILLVAGVPACLAYAGVGGERFRVVAGTINLALAFLTTVMAAAELMTKPPAEAALATGFLSVVLAVTAAALRSPRDRAATAGSRELYGGSQPVSPPYPAQPYLGMPPAPGGQQGPPGTSPQSWPGK
jgi:hypothetical protein